MRVLLILPMTLLSSCITIGPPPHRGPIVPLMPPPDIYQYISHNSLSDQLGIERYTRDIDAYEIHVRNHLRYIRNRYNLHVPKQDCKDSDVVVPELDVTTITDENITDVLMSYIETLTSIISEHNHRTISSSDKPCV